MQLKQETLLQGGRYRIEQVLGQGGFGITYLAIQSGLERKVAIKEFFMKELCERDISTNYVTQVTESNKATVNRFKEKFLKEARHIAKLNHPHIVRIIDVFEENSTAYYVMEYAENGSLSEKVRKQGTLSEAAATRYILQVAAALDYIHKHKMNHLDVKPANILINEKNEAVLIDFGLSKQYDFITGNQTSTTPVGISHGYAPLEQYKEGGVQEFSPETDIYALGATFFKMLTGITPPNASDVNEDGVSVDQLKANGVSRQAITVICKAMEGRKRDRIKDVCFFIEGLKGIPLEDDNTTPLANGNNSPKVQKSLLRKWICSIIAAITIASISYMVYNHHFFNNAQNNIVTDSMLDNIVSDRNQEDTVQGKSDEINGHRFVDLGLSVKWATCNVGAERPQENGDYFAWGETNTKSDYSESNSITFDKAMEDIAGNAEYDAASANWGKPWRLPTEKECRELIESCKWTWTSLNGGYCGYHIISKINGNSIFLPAAGRFKGELHDGNEMLGRYWSSTPRSRIGKINCLAFDNSRFVLNRDIRSNGYSVRPVSE